MRFIVLFAMNLAHALVIKLLPLFYTTKVRILRLKHDLLIIRLLGFHVQQLEVQLQATATADVSEAYYSSELICR